MKVTIKGLNQGDRPIVLGDDAGSPPGFIYGLWPDQANNVEVAQWFRALVPGILDRNNSVVKLGFQVTWVDLVDADTALMFALDRLSLPPRVGMMKIIGSTGISRTVPNAGIMTAKVTKRIGCLVQIRYEITGDQIV